MWPELANIWSKLHTPLTDRNGSVTMRRFCGHETVANNGIVLSYRYSIDPCVLDQVKPCIQSPNNSSISQLLNVKFNLRHNPCTHNENYVIFKVVQLEVEAQK